MRIHVLFEHSADLQPHGSSYIRLLRPLQHPVHAGRWQVTLGTAYHGGADVVIVERTWQPGPGVLLAAEALVERLRREHTRLIYSLDDNLLDWAPRTLGQQGPSAEQLSAVRFFARSADGLIVSTSALRERLNHLNANIQVVPNALDEQLLPDVPERGNADHRRGVVIGFMGTHTHDADLRLILAPLRAVLRAHAGQLEFQLVGGVATGSILSAFADLPVRALDAERPVDYPAFMRWFTRQLRWDIAIAPLEDTVFNRAKSDIKFLDYAALGAAGIYSRVRAYTGTVRADETGLLVDNTEAAWRTALERLVQEADLRAQVAQNARHYLLTQRVLNVCARNWQQAILALLQAGERVH